MDKNNTDSFINKYLLYAYVEGATMGTLKKPQHYLYIVWLKKYSFQWNLENICG